MQLGDSGGGGVGGGGSLYVAVCCGSAHLRWRVDRLSTPERPAPRSPETPSASSAWRPTERF